MKVFKRIVRVASELIGGIAGLVFLRAPFTNSGLALTGGSIVVAIICVGAYMWSDPDSEDASNSN
jgi:hypothetical protein